MSCLYQSCSRITPSPTPPFVSYFWGVVHHPDIIDIKFIGTGIGLKPAAIEILSRDRWRKESCPAVNQASVGADQEGFSPSIRRPRHPGSNFPNCPSLGSPFRARHRIIRLWVMARSLTPLPSHLLGPQQRGKKALATKSSFNEAV